MPLETDPGAGLSRSLASFLAQARVEDVPSAVLHEAKRALLNGIATALAGFDDPVVARSLGVLRAFAGPPRASLIGRSERTDALTAAFLNAAAANVHDFDDTHPATIIHPTAPVAPALLSLCEIEPVTGRAVLHALALGMEVECRIGAAVSPGHYARGWHITATCGVFGAAAAAGRALRLDAARMLWALGIASAQSSGLVETLGTMAKSVGVGAAARGGLFAALSARAGVEGPAAPLEGQRGFLRVMSADPPIAAHITGGLGERWEMLDNTYKPYPCGIVLHAVIDACLALREAPGFALDGIRAITVRGHPLLRQRTDRPDVTCGREAQVSAQHCVAVVLLSGAAGLAQFSDAAVADPSVQDLRRRVRVEEAPHMAVEAAEVQIHYADGRTLARCVSQARGGSARPLSDRDLEDKLRALLAYGGADCDAEALIDAVWSLDEAPDASVLPRRAAARAPRAPDGSRTRPVA
ncbi:MAG: MmgE/PrpD family protein [Pseudomonadota bacterium]